MAESIAGNGGASGSSFSLASFGAQGGSTGVGGTVTVQTTGSISTGDVSIRTISNNSPAILAQSIGGGGGSGGSQFGLFFSSGGSGGNGGSGGAVTVNTTVTTLVTSGADSAGVFAESIGGVGGDGGFSGGLFALGGRASYASDGGTVQVVNAANITTGAPSPNPILASPNSNCGLGCSPGILAQSIGGGGGDAGINVGWFSIGGTGGAGGNGGKVDVQLSQGAISTNLAESAGVLASSIGGGGGFGSDSVGVGPWASVALGGSGGSGGSGGPATVTVVPQKTPSIVTRGASSPGVEIQSLGGGGGTGGFAIAVAGGNYGAISVAVGGQGGGGGAAGPVGYASSTCCASITTNGDKSAGIALNSEGGGGGDGNFAVSFAGSTNVAAAVSVGGKGDNAGNGAAVSVDSLTNITTAGDKSPGIFAQSLGGGGGDGGFSASGSASLGAGGFSLALGGSHAGNGGGGGSGDTVTANTRAGQITTSGQDSDGVDARSVGGAAEMAG
jgi:hypothetical protein